jgi:hypothetical protein
VTTSRAGCSGQPYDTTTPSASCSASSVTVCRRQTVEGAQHKERNAQFEHINAQANSCIARGVPFISVDTKKKELVRNFKNAGVEWQPKDQPQLVDVHDFPSDAIGKAIPYGVYDVADNSGLINVGTDHDTLV